MGIRNQASFIFIDDQKLSGKMKKEKKTKKFKGNSKKYSICADANPAIPERPAIKTVNGFDPAFLQFVENQIKQKTEISQEPSSSTNNKSLILVNVYELNDRFHDLDTLEELLENELLKNHMGSWVGHEHEKEKSVIMFEVDEPEAAAELLTKKLKEKGAPKSTTVELDK